MCSVEKKTQFKMFTATPFCWFFVEMCPVQQRLSPTDKRYQPLKISWSIAAMIILFFWPRSEEMVHWSRHKQWIYFHRKNLRYRRLVDRITLEFSDVSVNVRLQGEAREKLVCKNRKEKEVYFNTMLTINAAYLYLSKDNINHGCIQFSFLTKKINGEKCTKSSLAFRPGQRWKNHVTNELVVKTRTILHNWKRRKTAINCLGCVRET